MIAPYSSKKKAVNIITQTFDANPSVNIVIGSKGNRTKKISRLAYYAFEKAFNRKGVFLSDNKQGVALCFRSDLGSVRFKELIYELRFAAVLPMSRVLQTLKRESYIKKYRLKCKHLYFWFFGVQKGADQAGFELKNQIFILSKKEQLPILLETSVLRNKVIYERYGFKVYHEWNDSGDGKKLWFMLREPENN